MGIADKIKPSKDNRIKVKRIRFGNIKDFHGRRQHGENILGQEETSHASESSNATPKSCFSRKPISPSSIFIPSPIQTPKSIFIPKLLDKTKQSNHPGVPSEANKTFSFNAHISQWAQNLQKPLATPSTNVEFDMPYCYSEGLYSKVSADSFLNQSCEPASELWSPQADGWYEKAQLALQYYRYLCEQPSRMPLQTVTVKKTMAQLAAEQSALLGAGVYFEMFHNSGVRIGNIVFEEKNKSTLYLVPDHVGSIKPPECPGVQVRSESSIFTSSWQN